MGLSPKTSRLIIFGSLLAAIAFTGCGKSANQEFTALTDSFFQQWPALHPVEASELGIHSHDNLLPSPSDSVFAKKTRLYRSWLNKLKDINPRKLSTQNRIDYKQFVNGLQYRLFLSDTLRIQHWSPLVYTELLDQAFSHPVFGSSVVDSIRADDLLQRLDNLPRWLKQVLAILENPAEPHVRAAIGQARGIAADLEAHSLSSQFETITQDALRRLGEAESAAAIALTDFADDLEQQILPSSDRNFRLGAAYYQRMFHYILQTDWTPQMTLERAEKQVRTLQDEMYTAAAPLANQWWSIQHRNPSRAQKLRIIQRVLNSIDNNRQDPEQIVSYVNSQINQLKEFVRQHKILTIGSELNLSVSPGSPHFAGFPLISLRSPGPMASERRGVLIIQSIPGNWSQGEIQDYLEEHNNYALQLHTIYFGIPGQVVQQNYAFRYPSLVRALFASPTMINGWAHYSERMMIEEGWGKTDQRMQVTQLKWEIRRVLQTIIDQKAHTQEMSRSEALALLTSEGFMETGTAEMVWRRVQLRPVLASADYIGKELILDLRRRYQQRVAQDFSLNQFHKQLLSFGSPPVKYLRSLLLTGDL